MISDNAHRYLLKAVVKVSWLYLVRSISWCC